MKSYKNPQSTHWHVLGAGAIGCLWAAHLRQSGHEVTLVLKNQSRLEQFEQSPAIKVNYKDRQLSVTVNSEIGQTKSTCIQNLLVCTKSFDAADAIQSIVHRIRDDTKLILLFNGMGAQQEIAQSFPNSPLICGSTTEGAYLTAPFQVIHAGKGLTWFGVLNLERDNHRIKKDFMNTFSHFGLDINWDHYIYHRLWYKLAVNCVINPLTAIQGCQNRELLDGAQLISIQELCHEIEAVMDHLKIPRKESLYEQVISIVQATGDNYSSMCQDVSAGRQTEIDYINGYLCRQAKQLRIPTPLNQELYQRVKRIQCFKHD